MWNVQRGSWPLLLFGAIVLALFAHGLVRQAARQAPPEPPHVAPEPVPEPPRPEPTPEPRPTPEDTARRAALRELALLALDHDALVRLAAETGSSRWARVPRFDEVDLPDGADAQRGFTAAVRAVYGTIAEAAAGDGWIVRAEIRIDAKPSWHVTWLEFRRVALGDRSGR